uniref:Uncharacterized protein n=1 Tax=Rousettus aegyptiacus TaxID=9407 RepID=A0A7J8DX68_ROUAE|nr:hypothetical protein HJG63_008273 [Rousettus aegyptiacus]
MRLARTHAKGRCVAAGPRDRQLSETALRLPGSAGKRLNDLSGLKWVREQHGLRRAGTVSRAWRPRAWRAPRLSGFPHVISSPSAPSASPQGRDPEHPDDERGFQKLSEIGGGSESSHKALPRWKRNFESGRDAARALLPASALQGEPALPRAALPESWHPSGGSATEHA